MSLRFFHLVFILVAMVMADMFGAWTVHTYTTTHDLPLLLLGLGSMVGGLLLAVYSIVFVRRMDALGIH